MCYSECICVWVGVYVREGDRDRVSSAGWVLHTEVLSWRSTISPVELVLAILALFTPLQFQCRTGCFSRAVRLFLLRTFALPFAWNPFSTVATWLTLFCSLPRCHLAWFSGYPYKVPSAPGYCLSLTLLCILHSPCHTCPINIMRTGPLSHWFRA